MPWIFLAEVAEWIGDPMGFFGDKNEVKLVAFCGKKPDLGSIVDLM